jgi:hypothetical protein
MSDYVCNICLKDFKVKSHYDNHKYKRQKPCKPSNIHLQNLTILTKNSQNSQNPVNNNYNIIKEDVICTYCHNSFSNIYSKLRHLNTCKVKKQIDIQSNENALLKQKLDEMAQKIAALEQKQIIPQVVNNNNNVVNNNNNVVNNNVVNNNVNNVINVDNSVKIVNFNDEKIHDLDRKQILSIIKRLLKVKKDDTYEIVKEFIRCIHFNDDFPEFQNIFVTDVNRKRVTLIKDNKKVIEQYDDDMKSQIIDHLGLKSDALCEYIEDEDNNIKLNDSQKSIVKTPSDIINFDEKYDKPLYEECKDLNEYKKKQTSYNKNGKLNKKLNKSLYNNLYEITTENEKINNL